MTFDSEETIGIWNTNIKN